MYDEAHVGSRYALTVLHNKYLEEEVYATNGLQREIKAYSVKRRHFIRPLSRLMTPLIIPIQISKMLG